MKPSNALIILSTLVAVLAIIVSGAGLFWQSAGSPFPFTTLHGQTVQMYGQGIYSNDMYFKAPIFRGADAVTVFISVPLLVVAIILSRRGSLRGRLFLVGMLAYFLYNATSMALGVAYNSLVLFYVAYFSASLFAFILAFTSIDVQALAAQVDPNAPRRGMAIFMFVASLTVFVWLPEMLSALLQGQVPAGLGSYTTEVTYVLDPGIIAPTALLTGILLLRRTPLGYLLAAILLVLNALVGAMVIGQTVMQTLAGITLTIAQMIAYVGSFVVMSLFAVGLAVRYFRSIRQSNQSEGAQPKTFQPSRA